MCLDVRGREIKRKVGLLSEQFPCIYLKGNKKQKCFHAVMF